MEDGITVIGSSNTDVTITAPHLPEKGELIMGGDYRFTPGGKGANMAVASARLGGEVSFIGKIGNDSFGRDRIADLEKEGVNVEYVSVDKENPSGLALNILDKQGDSRIVVAPGANSKLNLTDIKTSQKVIRKSKIILLHLEIPLDVVEECLNIANKNNIITILNPAPAQKLSEKFLSKISIIVCNRFELEILTEKKCGHLETISEAAKKLIEAGIKIIIVTLGQEGAVCITNNFIKQYHTHKVEVVDTTGGGDSFIGAFGYYLSTNPKLEISILENSELTEKILSEAINFSLAVASLSVTKAGAQSSMPTKTEVMKFLSERTKKPEFYYSKTNLTNDNIEFLKEKAKKIRKLTLSMLTEAASGHPGGSLSAADILTVLYFHTLNINVNRPKWEDRDRFVLSKGHTAPALYACLAEKGFFPINELSTLRKLNSRLQGHPDMRKTPGIDMSTGSLGQGLSVSNGIALGAKIDQKDFRVYVLLGDGEIQEGEIWEAAMTSVHFKLDNLCAIIDYNGLQIGGTIGMVKSTIEPLVEKWQYFGWNTVEIDGHSIPEILNAFQIAKRVKKRPTIIIAHTIKGKGVPFMERNVEYHGSVLSAAEFKKALEELY